METNQWDQVKRVFQEARERPEPERAAYIAAAAGDNAQLRTRVEALLASDAEAGAFLASPTAALPPPAADSSDLFGRLQRALAGRYSLERELGRGGMGIVFLARDVALDRPVAIKVLPPEFAVQGDYRVRFLREARTAAGLSHPNIVPIHLVEERDGLVYFVMTLVDGESLGDRLRRTGPLKPSDAARLMQEVAWALGYAHGRGVIHRDIKPDNILIDKGSGRALVSDFGIARVSTTGTVSQQGEVIGTLRYMSPEQASADATIDGRADLYSLGATMYLALAGRLPFDSDNPGALVAMQVTQPAAPLRSVAKTVPPKLAEAVDRCLAKDPAARFANGEALADAISESQVRAREIAPSLREFIANAKTTAIVWYGLASFWLALISIAPDVMRRGRGLGSPLGPLVATLLAATVIAVIIPINSARKVLRAGLDERDIADAVAQSKASRDANVDYELARVERLGNFMSSGIVRGLMLLLGGWIGVLLVRDVGTGGFESLTHVLAISGGALAGSAVLAAGFAPRRRLMKVFNALTRGTPEYASLFQKLWAGPFGRWTFRIAGLGMRRAKTPPIPDAAPTEIVLGRAAGDVFEQLPSEVRARLGDVPEVIRGLEQVAARMRSRRDELQAVMAEAGALDGSTRRQELATDLAMASAAVEGRLGEAVSALESLRLDLLRLRAGVGKADDLTATIAEARHVQRAVDLELSAQHSVSALLASGR